MRRSVLKKLVRWTIGVLTVLVALLIVLILARDTFLKAAAERSIEEETGLRAVIGELTTTLSSGALHVRNLKLYNPAEFGGTLMADVPDLYVDLNAEKAAEGKLHFRDLKLVLSELNVVKNVAGRLNIDGVEKRIRERMHKRKRHRGEKFEFEFAGISKMHLTLRKVFYTDLNSPTRTRAMDLAVQDEVVTDLDTEEDLGRWAGGMMFRLLVQVSFAQLSQGRVVEESTSGAHATP